MTAQMDTFKEENSSTTHLIGQQWQKLIDLIESRPGESETKSFDGGRGGGGGSQYQYRAEDNILRTLQDVKRLRQKDMALFGRCPETDNFYTVVCSLCSMILMPHALKDHWEKRHGEEKSLSTGDKQSLDFPNKAKSKRIPPIEKERKVEKVEKIEKVEKVDKSKKVKPTNPLPDLSEETFKDSKRLEKSKRGKPPSEKGFDTDNLSSTRTDRGKPKGSRASTESQPMVALSPVAVSENGAEGSESREQLPRTKRRDKRRNDRKIDKSYDPDKHCGVMNECGKPCVRSILCKVHQVAMKRAVSDRTMPYDTLIRILRSQNDDERLRGENGVCRLPKTESSESILSEVCDLQGVDGSLSNKGWTGDHISIKTEEPPTKRLKIKEELDDDVDQSQFTLPSHLEALIDETLKTLKDVDESESLPTMIPVAPKPEPLLKWNFEPDSPPKTPSPPPQLVFDDIHWHSSHPKPLATNTFGCRLIGGLMSTCKKLDTLRKHLQSVWSSSTSSSPPIRSSYSDGYNSTSTQNANAHPKNNVGFPKYGKKGNQNRGGAGAGAGGGGAGGGGGGGGGGGALTKKNASSTPAKGGSTVKRKRRSNSNVISPVQNTTSNASDIISGLLISNQVPVQRTGSASVPTIPTGVIPVNSITGNGVPLRLFQGSLPVIASAAPNQPATFIQLNLCPPK